MLEIHTTFLALREVEVYLDIIQKLPHFTKSIMRKNKTFDYKWLENSKVLVS